MWYTAKSPQIHKAFKDLRILICKRGIEITTIRGKEPDELDKIDENVSNAKVPLWVTTIDKVYLKSHYCPVISHINLIGYKYFVMVL